jgi:hypothetical protein
LANFGRQAFLYDANQREHWMHALLIEENNIDSYNVKIGDYRVQRRLWYNDLQQLIILLPLEGNPLPQINIEESPGNIPENLVVYNDSKRGEKLHGLFNKLISSKETRKVGIEELKKALEID